MEKNLMASQTYQLPQNVYNYLLAVSVRESPVLAELREATAKLPMSVMQISPEQGQFMALLVQLIGAKKTIELGVFTGYSALVVAAALPEDGKVVACDISKEWTDIAQKFWEKAGVKHKIDLRLAPAAETLENLIAKGEAGTFDFAFIDAEKTGYDNYYEKCLQLLRRGGLIAIDNVLQHGRVADAKANDNNTKAIRALNEKIHDDKRVSISMVQIGDGLTLVYKR
jgi:predicted O-methyltransferase YrrM